MTTGEGLTYKGAGVDIEAADRFVAAVGDVARGTHRAGVVRHPAGFAGLFRADLTHMTDPLLAATCDGVGTKLLVARQCGRYQGLGQDLVAMNVNDLLPVGARPLFFLDYIATGTLDPGPLEAVVRGIGDACRQVGCALLGGETAEMPGVYGPGDFDLAGFAVGLVDAARVPEPATMRPGDVVLALPSSGVHANGLSLARKALLERGGLDLEATPPGLGRPLGEELLEPTALYVGPVLAKLARHRVRAMAHVTGGGLLRRGASALQPGLRMVLDTSRWARPAIFDLIQAHGGIDEIELGRTFNLGLGFLAIVDPDEAVRWMDREPGDWRRVGEVVAGEAGVELR